MIIEKDKVSIGIAFPNGCIYAIYLRYGLKASEMLLKNYSVANRVSRLLELGNLKYLGISKDKCVSYAKDLNCNLNDHRPRTCMSLDSFFRWSCRSGCEKAYIYMRGNWNYGKIDLKAKEYVFGGKLIEEMTEQERLVALAGSGESYHQPSFRDSDHPGGGLAKEFMWFPAKNLSLSLLADTNLICEQYNLISEADKIKIENYWLTDPENPIICVKGLDGKHYVWDGYKRVAISLLKKRNSINALIGVKICR